MCPEEFHSSFCSAFSPGEFLAAATSLSSSTATGPDKVAYPMLKHLPRSGIDQILCLSQSISNGYNKPRPGSWTILATIDFSKAFDFVWHPALFHRLISAGLPPCFARWTQSFLSDKSASVVFQNHKSRSFRVRRGIAHGYVLGIVLFSLFINDLAASLPSSVICSLYADNLAIRSSSPSVLTAVEATQGALIRLER